MLSRPGFRCSELAARLAVTLVPLLAAVAEFTTADKEVA